MALINLGAGLSEMGKSLAQTAQAWTLESMRRDSEQEKLKLIQAFTAGENMKQREFSKGEREAEQTYRSGEKALDRTQQMEIVNRQMENAVRTAQISAGPGYARVALQQKEFEAGGDLRRSQLEESKAGIEARKAQAESYKAESILKGIKAESERNILDAQKQLDDALTSNDPEKIKAAQTKMYTAEFSSKDEVQRVSLYQAQARLIEQAMSATQSKLVALQDKMTPEADALAATLARELERQRVEHRTALRMAAEALKNLPSSSGGGSAAGGGTMDLNKYLRRAAPVTGKPQGIVNQPDPTMASP